MNRKNVFLLLGIIVILFFIFVTYTVTVSNKHIEVKTFTLLGAEVDDVREDTHNFKWVIKRHSFRERVEGWINGNIVFENILKSVYLYSQFKGEKSLVFDVENNTDFIISVSDYGENMVVYKQVRVDQSSARKFAEEKYSKSDYSYSSLENEHNTNVLIELYNIGKGNSVVVADKLLKWRIFKNFLKDPIDNFDTLGISGDGMFVAYCMWEDTGEFVISVYDVKKETATEYKVYEKEGRFDITYRISISDDGKDVWFAGRNFDDVPAKVSLYSLNLDKNELSEKKVMPTLHSYKISSNKRYVIYDYRKSTKNDTQSEVGLRGIDNLYDEEFIIDTDIVVNGYGLSTSGNKVAYLKRNGEGAKLYIKDIENESSESSLIHTFEDLSAARNIYWDIDDNKLLVSYGLNSPSGSEKWNTCVVELSSTN